MQKRPLGRTGIDVSAVSFGGWAIGGAWGNMSDDESMAALRRAVELGVNFFDTADVYGDGRSERLLARLRREVREPFHVASKAGRRAKPHGPAAYTLTSLTSFVERSLRNLEVDAIDLLQLHCPPTDVYYMPQVFDGLDQLVRAGKLRFYGVSVERVEEALKAIDYPNVQSVQIIFNIFRQRPADLLLARAASHRVGILARLPLSSGMLAGKMSATTRFADNDHRFFNRDGTAFDRGETFSGIDFHVGLAAVEELRPLTPPGFTLAQLALAWILEHEAVTCVIPGAKRPSQVEENVRAANLPHLSDRTRQRIDEIYRSRIRPLVHHHW